MPKVQETIEALGTKGLRDTTKVLVGGRCLNDEIARTMGADAYGKDAWDAVVKAKALMGL
jgi:5-methyltetrahydrofolate--homocysteine methyltransferase